MNIGGKKGIYRYCGLLIIFFFFENNIWGEHFNKQSDRKKILLDTEFSANYYLNKANIHLKAYNYEQAKIYLDSASFYEKEIENPDILGFLYAKYGDYNSSILNEFVAHQYYYKAIEYYEKAETNSIVQIIQIFNNLAFSFIQKNDTESLKRIIDKVQPLITEKETSNIIDTYCIIAFYYNALYEKEKQSIFLDSAIYYDKQVIHLFENSNKQDRLRKEDISYNYINLASNLLKKDSFNLDSISDYLSKSEKLANPNDTAMLINQHWVKGCIAYQKENIAETEHILKDQLILMDNWLKDESLSMYIDVYDLLSEISVKKNNYKEAFLYEKEKIKHLNQIHDAQKYEVIRELETKYEVSQKEQKIEQLTERNRFQQKIKYLYLGIAILFLFALFVAIHWFRQKKKAVDIQLELTQSEKHEIELQAQLQEELFRKTELEKYDALLDSHFKKIQISEMDEEMQELKKEQMQLNTQIEEYDCKMSEYEKRKSQPVALRTLDPMNTSIVQDIYNLVDKRLKNVPEQKEYLEKLTTIDDYYFRQLKEKAGRELGIHKKYSVCFLIGMKTPHIVECLSVEPAIIRTVRNRLKKELNVEGNIDITTYLKQLFYTE